MSNADMTPCDEVLEDLQRYLDGELPESKLTEIRTHLARCYPCGERADFHDQLRAVVRRSCSDQAPPGLLEQIRRRLDRIQPAAE